MWFFFFLPCLGHSIWRIVVNVENCLFLSEYVHRNVLHHKRCKKAVFGIACEHKSSRIVMLLEREEATILESVILKLCIKNSPVSIQIL